MTKILIRDNFLSEETYNAILFDARSTKQDGSVSRHWYDYDPTPEIAQFANYFGKKRGYRELARFIHTATTVPNFTHKMHDEAEFKIMSAIIYLSPEKNHGTTFYIDGKQETIEWKPNRLMIFCGETGVTWHDYKSSDETRYTYNYFLVDPTRIENEAYKDHCIRV
tara:strand:+ start:8503 stop:9000 length:498 start_codon:yes stop_codon:yes gene_type:complete